MTRLGTRAIVCVLATRGTPIDPGTVTSVVEDLRTVYARVPGLALTWWPLQPRPDVLVVAAHESAEAPTLPLVSGTAIGGHGDATDGEVAAVIRDPQQARDLLGAWVAVGEHDGDVRIVSSPDLSHTLKTATAGDRRAWSTRGLAALRAVRAPLRIDSSRIPEFVTFDYVLGDDELLAGVRVLPEASYVDTGHDRETSYWSVADRMAARHGTTTPEDLRRTLTRDLRRVAALPSLSIAMTAGKDSRLVADCLHDLDARPAAFTMGRGTPDAVGAARVCDAFGWPHDTMPAPKWRPSWERAVAATAWTEGLQIVRDLLNPPPQWPVPDDALMLWGSGGEIGRAFYWSGAAAGDDATAAFRRAPLPLTRTAAEAFRTRTGETLEAALTVTGGDSLRALDVVYARGRMRKWLGRGVPIPGTTGSVTAYTSPALVRVLLDLPDAARRDGSAFLTALTLGSLPPALPVRQPSRIAAARARAHRAWRSRRPHPAVTAALRDRGGLPTRVIDVLGPAWWDAAVRNAQRNESDARLVWNALTVEALADLLDDLPAPVSG